MKRLRFILKYFSHLFDAKNTRGHGIHSPYLYRFTQNAIYEKNPFYVFPKIELLRENLKFDERKLFVKDYGTGIPKESLGKIWDRFYKIDASRGKDRKGTGLGLSIVKEIINAHNQNIDVISTEGVGTEFIFTLEKTK